MLKPQTERRVIFSSTEDCEGWRMQFQERTQLIHEDNKVTQIWATIHELDYNDLEHRDSEGWVAFLQDWVLKGEI